MCVRDMRAENEDLADWSHAIFSSVTGERVYLTLKFICESTTPLIPQAYRECSLFS